MAVEVRDMMGKLFSISESRAASCMVSVPMMATTCLLLRRLIAAKQKYFFISERSNQSLLKLACKYNSLEV